MATRENREYLGLMLFSRNPPYRFLWHFQTRSLFIKRCNESLRCEIAVVSLTLKSRRRNHWYDTKSRHSEIAGFVRAYARRGRAGISCGDGEAHRLGDQPDRLSEKAWMPLLRPQNYDPLGAGFSGSRIRGESASGYCGVKDYCRTQKPVTLSRPFASPKIVDFVGLVWGKSVSSC